MAYQGNSSTQLVFQPGQCISEIGGAKPLFTLYVDFGQLTRSLASALPNGLQETVKPNSDLAMLVELITAETNQQRCGAKAVIERLGEILIVRILRMQLDKGVATPGLLAGLSDDRISRALVSIHEQPEQFWRTADLADVAGLSQSRFKTLFADLVGESPGTYLRRWRLMLAKADIESGERVDKISRKYGYKAPDAFSRAYLKEYGQRPKKASLEATR
ncbi:AraC family transcriptional regulator [Maritalea mediterranea]|uniref:AraC family transcriptional regulator n=1 Tax=Maritalea mediterranea TaxID=2909667 RepID=A0ABS9E7C5_9HYPH|nr:AraC family transcriptional regulator [Maritalea mediterranea]